MSYLYKLRGTGLFYVTGDAVITAIAVLAALLIGHPGEIDGFPWGHALYLTAAAWVMLLPSFYLTGMYRILWQYSNVKDMYRLLCILAACLPLYVLAGYLFDEEASFGTAVVTFIFTGGGCVLYRALTRDLLRTSETVPEAGEVTDPWGIKRQGEDKRVLIAGAGEAGRMILSEYQRRGMERCIAGFVDDNHEKTGRILNGKKVYAGTAGIASVIESLKINEVIIAMPSVESAVVERIIVSIRRDNPEVLIRTLPPFTRIFDRALSPDLRELGIADLLGREEFAVDVAAIREHFTGKNILVTGAGGSIGSELCRQLLQFDIKKIVAVGKGEHSIYTLAKSMNEHLYYMDSGTEIYYRVADVRDTVMLDHIFERFKPDIVIHAAAHKHVPLMEYNEIEAVRNNVGGSGNVFETCCRHGTGECILVSTDKAVRPVNIMGATKRLAELVARYYHTERGLKTAIVRFGNVIGSRGSVIPLFREQIRKGGPVTVTHPEVSRFFMSIPEASILVINAAAYAAGGEVFVLDMGSQFRVVDVARKLIRLYGLEPDRDIKIEYTGLRPGEKLYEELFYDREKLVKTRNEKIFILSSSDEVYNGNRIKAFTEDTLPRIYGLDPLGVRRAVREMVPEYEFGDPPDENGKNRVVN